MGEQWKQWLTIFLGSKITADGDYSHEMKRCLLLGRKVMTNLDSILKSRDISLPIKVRLLKAMVFPVVTYGCKSWTVKKAECQRIDAFFFYFFKFYFIFKLYNIVLVLPNIKMNPPQVYLCSPSWTLLLPPSPIPSLWVVPVHQPQASSIVHRTWTGNSFHTWYFTCFNAILPNLPTLSLSHIVHKTVLYISVSFAVSYTGLLYF